MLFTECSDRAIFSFPETRPVSGGMLSSALAQEALLSLQEKGVHCATLTYEGDLAHVAIKEVFFEGQAVSGKDEIQFRALAQCILDVVLPDVLCDAQAEDRMEGTIILVRESSSWNLAQCRVEHKNLIEDYLDLSML